MSDTTETRSVTLASSDEAARPGGRLSDQPRLEQPPRGEWWERITVWQRALLVLLEFLGIFVIWQVAIGTFELVNPIFMPTPTDVIEGFGQLFGSGDKSVISATDQDIWVHIKRSAYSYTVGYSIGVMIGIPFGLLIGTSRVAYKLTGPLVWSLYAVPWVALRPMATVWFGFEAAPVIFIVSFASLFPILLNTAAGPQTVDKSLLRSAEVFGASKLDRFRKIILPSSLPFILIGLRQAIIIAMISLLVAEIVGSSKGLGALIVLMTSNFRSGAAFAVIVMAVTVTIILGQGARYAAEKLAPWHFGHKGR